MSRMRTARSVAITNISTRGCTFWGLVHLVSISPGIPTARYTHPLSRYTHPPPWYTLPWYTYLPLEGTWHQVYPSPASDLRSGISTPTRHLGPSIPNPARDLAPGIPTHLLEGIWDQAYPLQTE